MTLSDFLERTGEEFVEKECFGINVLENVSGIYGFAKVSEKRNLKPNYKPYSIEGLEKYPIVANNDVYGYNLIHIHHVLKETNPTEINVPDINYPAYFNVGSGYILLLAPLSLKGIKKTHKLKRPIQTLNKFF